MEVIGNINTTEAPITSTTSALQNAGGTPSILSDVTGNRPAAGEAGRLFVATDTNTLYRDTGSFWAIINPVGALPIIGTANGGTGVTTTPGAGQLLIGDGAGYINANLTAGNGISVTNGAGSITLAVSLSAGAGISITGTSTQTIEQSLPYLVAMQNLTTSFNTTVITSVNAFPGITTVANAVYEIDVLSTVRCSSTGGIKFQITAPTGSTVEGWSEGSTTTITTLSRQRLTAINTLTATATNTAAITPAPHTMRAIVTTGATTGTLSVGVASGTAGQTSTMYPGSVIRITRLS